MYNNNNIQALKEIDQRLYHKLKNLHDHSNIVLLRVCVSKKYICVY